ncbi:MAG: zinc-binding dehydrogenase, partial [bacterium]
VLRYAGLSLEELTERAAAMNGGKFYRATFDFVGGEMKKLCCLLVDYWGAISSIAPEPGAPIGDFFHSQLGPLFTKSASFHSVFLRAPVRGGGPDYYGPYHEALETIRGWFEAGSIQPPAAADMGLMTAENIARAHTILEEGHVQGKLVLSVGGSG